MPLTCSSTDEIIKRPANLNYSNPSPNLPFTLNGAPYANKPESENTLKQVIKVTIPGKPGRPATATLPAEAPTPDTYEYKVINLNTPNIIGSNDATTLKYENTTYKQKFIAVHSGFWGENSKRYVSVVFLNPESNVFHLCIPIEYRNTSQDENLFLKHWLRSDSPLPSGFTFNEILNFRGENVDKVQFAILQYCLKFNKTIKSSPAPPYTLCLFKTPLYVNSSDIEWISNFPDDMTFKSSFNGIFNYMLKDRVYNHIDPRLISTAEHFSNDSTTVAIPIPSFFIVKSVELTGKSYEIFVGKQIGNGVKGLSNIKCYPIDLANEVDEDGSIYIDEDSKKPIDIKMLNRPELDNARSAELELKRQKQLNNLSFIVVFSILFGIVFIALIVAAVYFFRGTPATPLATKAAMSSIAGVAGPGGGPGGGLATATAAAGVGALASTLTQPQFRPIIPARRQPVAPVTPVTPVTPVAPVTPLTPVTPATSLSLPTIPSTQHIIQPVTTRVPIRA